MILISPWSFTPNKEACLAWDPSDNNLFWYLYVSWCWQAWKSWDYTVSNLILLSSKRQERNVVDVPSANGLWLEGTLNHRDQITSVSNEKHKSKCSSLCRIEQSESRFLTNSLTNLRWKICDQPSMIVRHAKFVSYRRKLCSYKWKS